MEIHENLNKENFWNDVYAKYPDAVQLFCDWIDEYKKCIGWSGLFRDHLNGDAKLASPIVHDLPHAFQLGIWITFVESRGIEEWNVDIAEFSLSEDILRYMEYTQGDIDAMSNEGNIDPADEIKEIIWAHSENSNDVDAEGAAVNIIQYLNRLHLLKQ